MTKIIVSLAFVFGCMSYSHADTIVRNAASGNWSTSSEWSNLTNAGSPRVPGTASGESDNAIINAARDFTLDADVTGALGTVGNLTVGNQNPGTAITTFTATSNATLNVTGSLFIGANGSPGGVTLADGAALSFGGNLLMGRGNDTDGTPASSSLTFELGAGGWTSALSLTGNLIVQNALVSQYLVIDGGAFTGGAGSFTLVDVGGAISSAFDNGDISFSHFGSEYIPTITQNTGDVVLSIAQIPEPSSLALLLAGFVGLLGRRFKQ